MEERITSVQVVVLWLSFTSVTTGNFSDQVHLITAGNTEEAPNLGRPFTRNPPEAVAKFHKTHELNATDTFTETTEGSVRNLYDGNRPDDGTFLTHEHVDQTIGFVPPTKRVKKILPPFAATNAMDATNPIKRQALTNNTHATLVPNTIHSVTEQTDKNYLFNLQPHLQGENNHKEDQKGNPPQGRRSVSPQTTTLTNPYSVDKETKPPATQSPPPNQPSLSVPKEHHLLLPLETPYPNPAQGDQQDEKHPLTREKSIWDLLRERQRLRGADAIGDGTKPPPKNHSEVTTSEKTPFDHFDADSAEIESKMADIKMDNSNLNLDSSYALPWLSSKPEMEAQQGNKNNLTDAWLNKMTEMAELLQLTRDEHFPRRGSINIITNDQVDEPETHHKATTKPPKWFLFLLAGNATIIQLRRHDFTKYLKLNLAARLSIEYDDIKLNKLVLIPPKILLNVTVFAPRDHIGDKREKSLLKMTATNATLLELSGEEYHLIRFFSIDSLQPEAHKRVKSSPKTDPFGDLEFIFYTFLGSCCACALIFLFLVSLNKYFQKVRHLDWPWLDLISPALTPGRSEPPNRDDLNRTSPSLIFSRRFSEPRVAPDRSPSALWTDLESPGGPPWCTEPPAPDAHDRGPPATKLHIYNCHADSLLFPAPLRPQTT